MKKYINQIPTPMNMGLKSIVSMLRDSVTRGACRRGISQEEDYLIAIPPCGAHG